LADGASHWITGEAARNDVQHWRARSSAVMTGVGTLLADDPQLNVRAPGFKGRQPLRVVLDSYLRSPPGARMFSGLGGSGTPGAVACVDGFPAGDVVIFAALGGDLPAGMSAPSQALICPRADCAPGLQERRAALLERGVRIEEVAADD